MAACRKCGGQVKLSEALEAEWVKLGGADGMAVIIQHEVCPDEKPEPKRSFSIHISVQTDSGYEDSKTVELAMFKVTQEADRFADALPMLANKLGPKWDQLMKTAHIVDADLNA